MEEVKMFDIDIKWEHLTDETKRNIIDEFISNLCVEDLQELLENIVNQYLLG